MKPRHCFVKSFSIIPSLVILCSILNSIAIHILDCYHKWTMQYTWGCRCQFFFYLVPGFSLSICPESIMVMEFGMEWACVGWNMGLILRSMFPLCCLFMLISKQCGIIDFLLPYNRCIPFHFVLYPVQFVHCPKWANSHPFLHIRRSPSYNWDPQKLSVIRSSGASAIGGLLKYWSEWKDSRDFQNCPLYRRCPLLRGVRVR